ncbi:ribonuclease HII [bacterium]|nr:ribonuclease HII [bacterium]
MNSLFDFDFDFNFNQNVIGTDEAGRGPAAGGVFASAVYFNNRDKNLIEELSALNDSKKLTQKKREQLYPIILKNTINSTVCIEVEEIEKNNILNCSLKAMKLACEDVIRCAKLDNFVVLVDGNRYIKNFSGRQQTIVKGDSKSASIAAASILAKVSRDNYMRELDKKFPQYNWAKNAGYLTAEHIEAIEKFGTCKYHRQSFLKKIKAKQLTLGIGE